MSFEEIKTSDGKDTIALIVRTDFKPEGLNFLSKDDYPMQLGINSYAKGSKIKPHIHIDREIIVKRIQEMVYVKSGVVQVNFYGPNKEGLGSRKLSTGDLAFFISGGHGFEILEGTTIIEVKQGPYSGKAIDKMLIE